MDCTATTMATGKTLVRVMVTMGRRIQRESSGESDRRAEAGHCELYSYERYFRTSGGSHQGAVESEQVREHSDGPSSERGRLRATAVQTEESQARTGASPLSSRPVGFLRVV